MTDVPQPAPPRTPPAPGPIPLRQLPREFAVQDWLVLAFLVILNVAAHLSRESPDRVFCVQHGLGLFVVVLTALVLVRGGILRDRFFAPLVYRFAVGGGVGYSYFYLGRLLPILNDHTVDEQLHQIDLALFGVEPALAMDAWVTPLVSQWFAFFYYSYFFLIAAHLFPILFGSRDERRLGEFGLGIAACFCVGHVGYMLVPGYGPVRALADQFVNPLPSGLWTDLVMVTVTAGGSQLDIFPSLHTAAPTFISLYSLRHRAALPFRYTWPVTSFFTLNIIISTMFLRWHYLIDVVAGLALAVGVTYGSAWAVAWEMRRRVAGGLRPNWSMFGGFREAKSGGFREAESDEPHPSEPPSR